MKRQEARVARNCLLTRSVEVIPNYTDLRRADCLVFGLGISPTLLVARSAPEFYRRRSFIHSRRRSSRPPAGSRYSTWAGLATAGRTRLFPAEVPVELSDLIMHLLQKDATARPGSSAAVANSLAQIECSSRLLS